VDVNSYFHECRNYRPALPSSAERAAKRPFSYPPLERFPIRTTERIPRTYLPSRSVILYIFYRGFGTVIAASVNMARRPQKRTVMRL